MVVLPKAGSWSRIPVYSAAVLVVGFRRCGGLVGRLTCETPVPRNIHTLLDVRCECLSACDHRFPCKTYHVAGGGSKQTARHEAPRYLQIFGPLYGTRRLESESMSLPVGQLLARPFEGHYILKCLQLVCLQGGLLLSGDGSAAVVMQRRCVKYKPHLKQVDHCTMPRDFTPNITWRTNPMRSR